MTEKPWPKLFQGNASEPTLLSSPSGAIKNSAEKDRLVRLIQSIKPKGFGVIIRTVAQNKKVADLHADMTGLTDRWKQCYDELKNAHAPKKVLGELNRTSSILRDILNKDFRAGKKA